MCQILNLILFFSCKRYVQASFHGCMCHFFNCFKEMHETLVKMKVTFLNMVSTFCCTSQSIISYFFSEEFHILKNELSFHTLNVFFLFYFHTIIFLSAFLLCKSVSIEFSLCIALLLIITQCMSVTVRYS